MVSFIWIGEAMLGSIAEPGLTLDEMAAFLDGLRELGAFRVCAYLEITPEAECIPQVKKHRMQSRAQPGGGEE